LAQLVLRQHLVEIIGCKRERNLAAERQFGAGCDGRIAAVDRARETQAAVANALNAAAERIERTTQVLNRTVGGGVAIG